MWRLLAAAPDEGCGHLYWQPASRTMGQNGMGQAGAAGGFIGLVEALRQVLGTAGGTQVADATTAMVSGFGMINYDRGVCTSAAIVKTGSPA